MGLTAFKDFVSLANTAKRIARTLTITDDVIYVISHVDADGLTTAGILSHLLLYLNKPFVIKFVNQLKTSVIETLVTDINPKEVIFCDLGSGQLKNIAKMMTGLQRAIIIDHHIPADFDPAHAVFKLFHLNPWLFGYDGGVEISSAGLAYLIARVFAGDNEQLKDLSKYAIVGALGDNQDVGTKRALVGLNKLILKDAEKRGIIKSNVDILLQGREWKPLYQSLAETYRPVLPGITNSMEGALSFVQSLGLGLGRLDLDNITLADLNEEQKALLLEKLVERLAISLGENASLDAIKDMLIGYSYIITDEPKGPTRDAREFATLLNACGKLGRPEVGFALLVNRRDEFYNESLSIYKQYRYMLSDILNKVRKSIKDLEEVKMVDGRDFIPEGLSSTVASILADTVKDGDIILVLSKTDDDFIKVSVRKTRYTRIKDVRKIIMKVIKKIERSEGGGHKAAAGAYIPADKVSEFLENICKAVREELK